MACALHGLAVLLLLLSPCLSVSRGDDSVQGPVVTEADLKRLNSDKTKGGAPPPAPEAAGVLSGLDSAIKEIATSVDDKLKRWVRWGAHGAHRLDQARSVRQVVLSPLRPLRSTGSAASAKHVDGCHKGF